MSKEQKTYVEQLNTNEEVTTFFLVKEKQLRQKKTGEPFLSLILSDRSGDIMAVMWEQGDAAAKTFEEGDVVKVHGWVESYQNHPQVKVQRLRKAAAEEIDMYDYLPASAEDPLILKKEIEAYVAEIKNSHLQQLLESFFNDEEFYSKFSQAPAAKSLHHVCIGGLLEHTASVTRLCKSICGHYSSLRQDLLMSGALLHDLGKIKELRWQGSFDYTDEGRLLGHILLGLEMVKEKIRVLEDFPPELMIELEHILISHHGHFEFGSPKRPKTMEALALHYADDLDAKMNIFAYHLQQGRQKGKGPWTGYHKILERYLYLGNEEEEGE